MINKIGFIGQGWVGKNYADNFEKRGYKTVRYSLEKEYAKNGEEIKECEIVFIAVPAPTTEFGFDDKIVRNVIKKVGKGKIAVIKSTVLPGATESIQKENPNIYVVHAPEFLREKTVIYDVANPDRNIIGIPADNEKYKKLAKKVLAVLPKANFELICPAREAELIKYANNCFLYIKVLYANLLYDFSQKLGCDWDNLKNSLAADSRIGASHLDPVHSGGRGAGGDCFIKDFASFVKFYRKETDDRLGLKFLESAENKNIDLLFKSRKDIDLLKKIYKKEVFDKLKK